MYFAIDWAKRIDFDLLRQERTKSLNEQIKKFELDALLCFKAESIRYMTGYRPLWWPISFLTRNAAVMAPDKEPILFPTSGCVERCWETMYWMKKENMRPLATMEDPGIAETEVRKKLKPKSRQMLSIFPLIDLIRETLSPWRLPVNFSGLLKNLRLINPFG